MATSGCSGPGGTKCCGGSPPGTAADAADAADAAAGAAKGSAPV